jgi:outer membrane protein assembly factor BamB
MWRSRVSGGVRAAPVLSQGVVIVATVTDSLFTLDALTGAIRARRATAGAVLAAPAASESLLIAGSSAGTLEAYHPLTLEVRWSLDLGDAVVGHVALRDGVAYALAGRGSLWAVPVANPSAARRVDLGVVTRAGPAPAPGGILVAAVNGEIALVDLSGTRRWSARLQAPLAEPPIVDSRTIVVASQRGQVVAFR